MACYDMSVMEATCIITIMYIHNRCSETKTYVPTGFFPKVVYPNDNGYLCKPGAYDVKFVIQGYYIKIN